MRLVLSWLREFVSVEMEPEALADVLAMKGAHLESLERPWGGLEGVIVARVAEVRDHPNSDKLCLARVATGSGEQEVVVGVRNMRPGDLVPLAPPGARVPTLPEPLGAREIRGVVSNGMLCSARELALSQDHGGILVLPDEDHLEPGLDLKRALGLDEVVLDLEIETNRPDLLSVLGLAREVAAATDREATRPDTSVDEGAEDAGDVATVRVDDPDGCPLYLARVIRGLGGASTPLRVQARLTAAGVRPISPAVDATNYVMLELGQPLHAFDLARLEGPGIVVRRAEDGEVLRTLDGVERTMKDEDLLICDVERPVAIAGVMGGVTSEVGDGTTDVLLESAYFDPRSVLRTSRRLQLLTDASIRFSRGTDPEGAPEAAARAAALMVEWSGDGTVLRGSVDVGGAPARRVVRARAARTGALLGYDVDAAGIVEALGRIEITATLAGDGSVDVEVPGFRPDIVAEVDVIEEVVRIHGYDRLPSTVPPSRQPGGEQESYALRRRIRELLVRAGLREASSLSFASRADVDLLPAGDPVRVANPPSADEPFLRTSLLPGVLHALRRNVDRGARSVALFEVGHVFELSDPVREREHVAGVLSGQTGEGLWAERRVFDVLDAKGALEVLLEGLGAPVWDLREVPAGPFHPGRSAVVRAGGTSVGLIGELHPAVGAELDLPDRVALFEIDVDALGPKLGAFPMFTDVPRFPPLRRDLAFVVDATLPAEALRSAIVKAGGDLVDRCVLFDVHAGPPVPEGRKSLAFAVDFRAADRTLTDADADAAVATIVAAAKQGFGAELRSG
jgi:phenylalanyl-tRNA synthetase beta chain